MGEWRVLTLKDAGVHLLDCVHKTPPAAETGLPYVAIPQMHNGEINLSEARKISLKHFKEWTQKTCPKPFDVVLSRRCNPGETAYVRNGMVFALGQNLVLLRADNTHVRSSFLRWLVRSHYWWDEIEKFRNVGAVFDSLRCADVPKFQLPIPPLKDQGAIALLLDSLDDKIDLNRRMNETLEAMAQAILKDWFVDFGPVRAKAEGRPPYLSPEVWALFPDALDDEDKPVGWGVASLSEFAYLNPESWSKNSQPVKIKYVDLANTKWGVIETVQQLNWKEAPSRAQRILRIGDTIVGTVRPGNGSFSFIGQEGFTGSTGFAVLRPKMDRYREFVYLSATSSENIERLTHLADGAAYPAVRPDVVIETESIKSDEELLVHFSEIVRPLFFQIESNKVMSKDLAQFRDLLLPKLMSGEIRLRDAEKIIGESL